MKTTFPVHVLVLLLLLTGCQFAQSAFARTASQVGSAFAAASATISAVHKGEITTAYARSSFVDYRSELGGIDQQLPTQSGAPDARTLAHLLTLYRSAMEAVNQPCLETRCNWRAQVAAIDRASKAFLEAGSQ